MLREHLGPLIMSLGNGGLNFTAFLLYSKQPPDNEAATRLLRLLLDTLED